MTTWINELYGEIVQSNVLTEELIDAQWCPYKSKKCDKIRKSEPGTTIGTCTISTDSYSNVIICPHRFLKDDVVFNDAKRFLVSPEIEEEILVVPELAIPGGSVDFFLISRNTRSHKITDFVGIEFQALDTTGSIWGQRQLLISKYTTKVKAEKVKPCGFNWKMTAKTILVQLHHKVKTFESLGKKLVLVCQDHLIDYMYREFKFDMLSDTSSRNSSIVFHGYSLNSKGALCLTKELFGDSETLLGL